MPSFMPDIVLKPVLLSFAACVTTLALLTGDVSVAVAESVAESASSDQEPVAADAGPGEAAPGVPENPFPQAVPVPAGILDGATEWMNTSHPLSLRDLRGKIVLLDFWTYCCINCMHVLPDLKFLEEKYGRELVVIGVHSAKFDNEKLSQNIRNAILRYEIHHPVINDSEMTIWRRFGVEAWPTLALIDPEGKYIGSQSGEGNRELFDTVIGRLVDYHRARGTLDENPLLFDLESTAGVTSPLRFPGKVLADPASERLLISDTNHNRIVITDWDGLLLDVVGSGRAGRLDGSFRDAEFDHPQGMALHNDVLWVADTENHLLRVVSLGEKTVTTLAGTGHQGHPGQPMHTPLRETPLNSPWSITHVDGTLFVAMAGSHQIWSHQLGTDQVNVHAGTGREDVIDGPLSEAAFAQPSEITVDAEGRFLYVADSEGSALRRVPTSGGNVTTVAGTSGLPRGQSLFAFGDADGVGNAARLQHPLGVAYHAGHLYVADSYNHKIKRIRLESSDTSTWLGDGQAAAATNPAQLNEPGGVSAADGQLFIADTNNHRICVADLETTEMRVLSLTGLAAPSPPARRTPEPEDSAAVLLQPQAFGPSGEILVTVSLTIPAGYKRNELAPVTWSVTTDDDQTIIPSEVIGVREEATFAEGVATFRLPLTKQTGTASLLIRMQFGFCANDESLCRLATAAWRVPATVAEDEPNAALQLTFPAPDLPK